MRSSKLTGKQNITEDETALPDKLQNIRNQQSLINRNKTGPSKGGARLRLKKLKVSLKCSEGGFLEIFIIFRVAKISYRTTSFLKWKHQKIRIDEKKSKQGTMSKTDLLCFLTSNLLQNIKKLKGNHCTR